MSYEEWSPLPATVQSCDDPDKPVTTGDKLAPPDSKGRLDMLAQGLRTPKGMSGELSSFLFQVPICPSRQSFKFACALSASTASMHRSCISAFLSIKHLQLASRKPTLSNHSDNTRSHEEESRERNQTVQPHSQGSANLSNLHTAAGPALR